MNNMKKSKLLLPLVFFLASNSLFAQEDIDLRGGAGAIDRKMYAFEDGIMAVAQTVSKWAGKLSDSAVYGTQQIGNIVLKPIVTNIDPKKWLNKDSTSSRNHQKPAAQTLSSKQ